MSALSTIANVHASLATAGDLATEALQAARANARLNCFTVLLDETAAAAAAVVDRDPCQFPLAGLPFVAKDLFDVAGRTTLAGSKLNCDDPPAQASATAITRLTHAGATLVGLTNMDEYAYGFSTENAHYGTTRNPHDPARIAGGSSGGSAAAVAAGIVDLALGSDTNGSIRIPASLCGIYGLKPTFGRLSRAGAFPFVASLDHIGVFGRYLVDIALAYDVLQGPDPRDRACTSRLIEPVSPLLDQSSPPLRVGLLGGWFRQGASDDVSSAVEYAASAFDTVRPVVLEGAETARSAAFCMTGIEGGSLHAERLRNRPLDFDPAVRDRLIAGLLLPSHLSMQTRRVRQNFLGEAMSLFHDFDVLLAPATPCIAPKIGEMFLDSGGRQLPVRANLGLYTQPISFIGLPVIAAPICLPGLPIGMQIIGPPWGEAKVFQAARHLERCGRIGVMPLPAQAAETRRSTP